MPDHTKSPQQRGLSWTCSQNRQASRQKASVPRFSWIPWKPNPRWDYAMGLANTEAIGGFMLTDALNPRQLSEAGRFGLRTDHRPYTPCMPPKTTTWEIWPTWTNTRYRCWTCCCFCVTRLDSGAVDPGQRHAGKNWIPSTASCGWRRISCRAPRMTGWWSPWLCPKKARKPLPF